MILLEVDELNVAIKQGRTRKSLLHDISFTVQPGEICGLVGESGAGKSMIAKAILGLLPERAKIISGKLTFDGTDLVAGARRKRAELYGREIALIPQDPMVALNPSRKICDQLSDGIRKHLGLSSHQAKELALKSLEDVLIRNPETVMESYAHQLSGGMRQRVLIAMAFSTRPRLIIADEPTTALDVTVQRRVLSLIKLLQEKNDTAILFVTHDLGVVAKLCDRVIVLYGGRILEDASAKTIFTNPAHAYTSALLQATPRYDIPGKEIKPVAASLLQELENTPHNGDIS